MADPRSLGSGQVKLSDLGGAGSGTVIEPGVRIFGPAFVYLGVRVYIGHDTFLRAYPDGPLSIGDGCWIGPGCFINSFGGVRLGKRVGLGPGVKILSSVHQGGRNGAAPIGTAKAAAAIIDTPLDAREIEVQDGADIGAGAILLPGALVGAGAQVGAQAVVSGRVAANSVVAGIPARPIGSGS